MQQPTPVTSTLISSSSSSSFTSSLPQIPQFIVIHDKSQQNWKHPIVHYIFEDEIIPINITQEHCILVGLSEDGEKVENMYSLSHNFQITEEESSNIFRLEELVYEFKKRNELLRQTIEFSQN
ncbi:5672_t:CDS:2 [Entrophospora sp. SA101]|nr:5672_t:CDS:2 [Entrophospora sp. SA101]